MEKNFFIGQNQLAKAGEIAAIKKTGSKNTYYLKQAGKKDSFTLTNKSEIRKEFEEVKNQQGLIGKAWDGFKNLFGMKSGSKHVEEIIKKAEKGEITQEEAKEAIAKYKDGQNTSVDVVADVTSGILSVLAFTLAVPTGGASLAIGLGLATAVGAGIKVGVKATDALTTGKEYKGKDLLYDTVTGGINGLLGPITNGVGNTVTATIGKQITKTVVKEGAEEVAEQAVKQGIKQTAKNVILNQTVNLTGGTAAQRALAIGAGMAVDGALGGATDNMTRAALNGENVLKAGVEGAIGGAIMSPIIGGGFNLAGKAGHAINNKITTKIILPDGIKTKFKQGSIGDCALLSTIDGMMNNPKTAKAFKKSITKTVGGDYNVKIGDQIVRVTKDSLSDEVLSDKTGIRIFEQAYKQIAGDIDGGFAEVVAQQFGLNPIHITQDSITDELLDNLAKNQGETVLSFGTIVDTDGAIAAEGQRHYFTVKNINAENKTVTLTSPVDTSKTIELSYEEVKAAGISIDGGSVKELDLPTIARNTNDEVFRASKTQVDDLAATRAAARVTDDPELQSALIRMAKEEGIVIRTKEDAIPILQRIYSEIDDKRNVVVLDINPQDNNGMPKSNNLISRWFLEANGMVDEQLITLTNRELYNSKLLQVRDICSEWKPKDPIHKKIQKQMQKLQGNPQNNPLSVQKAREIIENCKTLSPDEILQTYSEEELAQALAKINSSAITTVNKNGGYAAALAEQLNDAISKTNGEPITIVIPDDCSLSGSSILCDTIKILDFLFKRNNIETEVNIVFAPMILGDEAQKVVSQFNNPDLPIDDAFLKKINALRADGEESFKGAREAFERIRGQKNVTIQLSDESIKATHFTQTETFKQIGEENPILQQQLLYLMQGPMDGDNALFGGFGKCGVMVVTPTDEFQIGDKIYAGKIPTNSVGFMEVLGQECGVLNDGIPTDSKGVFTKGTGAKYTRYCEWNGLSHPTTESDRIPIQIKNGIVQPKSA